MHGVRCRDGGEEGGEADRMDDGVEARGEGGACCTGAKCMSALFMVADRCLALQVDISTYGGKM